MMGRLRQEGVPGVGWRRPTTLARGGLSGRVTGPGREPLAVPHSDYGGHGVEVAGAPAAVRETIVWRPLPEPCAPAWDRS
jgi:hypothetical protein